MTWLEQLQIGDLVILDAGRFSDWCLYRLDGDAI